MAIGFPASFSAQIDLDVDRDTYHAKVSMSRTSWGERVEVSLANPGMLVIRSRGILPTQIFDWGKNKRNVERFCEIFEARSVTESRLPKQPPPYLDSAIRTPIERAFDENRTD